MQIPRDYAVRVQSKAANPPFVLHSTGLVHAGRTSGALKSRGFTLIEIILVMTLIVIGASFLMPQLSGFFRGRIGQSEARQLISLAHMGQSRAASGGVPIILWFDSDKNQYGLEEEPGYSDKDPNAESFDLNENLKIQIPADDGAISQPTEVDSSNPHMQLPHITFMPDGSIADGSPKTIQIIDVDKDDLKVSVIQSRERNQYEIGTTEQQ